MSDAQPVRGTGEHRSGAGHPADDRAGHSRPAASSDGGEILRPVAPTLTTERLVLRHVRASDFDYYARAHADEDVTRHVGGPINAEDAWRRALTGAGLWSVVGFGLWMVDRKADGRTIGHIGFFDFRRDTQPSFAGEPEMGWIFLPEAHGQGYAFEACSAAAEWTDRTLGVNSYPAIIALENGPSMRLAERLGFVRQADAVYRGEPIAYFRRAVSPTHGATDSGK